MVNAGNGGNNGIEYMGIVRANVETGRAPSLQLTPKSGTRGNGNYPFKDWDMMRYTGYAVVDDVEIESQTVEKAQNASETIPLKFDVARPEVVTNDASNITTTSAMLHGEVTADNNANVTERGFCYGTAPYPTYSSSPRVEAGNGLGTFSATINGLTATTTYYTRAYAKNVVGLSYGANLSFRTLDTLPVVTTTEPSNITATTFTSGGVVITINSSSLTARGICWNTTGAPTIADSHTTQTGGLGSFTSNITDLDCGTIYYVRAYATNSVGTAYGEEFSVTTTQELAQVITANISDITDNSAVCGGEVSYDGCSEVTARGMCWNSTGTPTIADSHTTDGNGMGDFTSHLTHLSYATTYYVRAYATNGVGTAYGNEVSFTTNPILPTVTTMETTDVTATTFTCGGDVTNDGGAEVTARGICWSTEPNPTISDNYTTDGDGTGTFTSNVNGLSCGTTYYMRAYATNNVGTAYGEEYSVTTTDTLPEVELHTAQVNATTIVAQSEVLSENCATVTARGVCWSTTGVPTITDSHTTDGNGLGNYNSIISGLNANTNYYVRAYATNSAGTEYGQLHTYHTLDTLPTVTTTVPFDVAHTNFNSGGEVTAMNSSNLTACGICWNTTGMPTIMDSHTTQSGGLGSYISHATGLICGTTYYVRAYATNSVGTAYGDEYSVTTLPEEIPHLTTDSVYSITNNSAMCGVTISFDGCSDVIARGVCWDTLSNPTTSNSHTIDGSGIGSFSSSLTGLSGSTTYYVRAYAINSVGIAYGNEVCLTTPFHCGTSKISDIDGNIYNTVQIGSQCWMKENLRTTKYADSTIILQGSDTSTTIAYWYYPDNNDSNKSTYGLLYNWKAVMQNSLSSDSNPSRVQGICPTGWHVPSDAEWTQLTDYVSNQNQYVCGNNSEYIAKSLASTEWNMSSSECTCCVSNTPAINNATGFSALPAGYYNWRGYSSFGNGAGFWSATEESSSFAKDRDIGGNGNGVNNSVGNKFAGSSIRCISNTACALEQLPTISTTHITEISATSANSGGNVTSDGGTNVVARGVCWSSDHLPTISDNHTNDGSGTGNFTSTMTRLTAVTTYYVRAYATNSGGTTYGELMSFTTSGEFDGQPCPNTATITDIDSNTYNTVMIGRQCWMKENLRTTKYADGTEILQGSDMSSTTAHWYYSLNNSSTMSTYGLLYNRTAVLRNDSLSYSNPSEIQGICPTGWHVPSKAEWKQLTDYVKSQSQYLCENDNTYIAKALAYPSNWRTSTVTCAIGNTASNNNATGFSAMPAGGYEGSYVVYGTSVCYWSTSGEFRRFRFNISTVESVGLSGDRDRGNSYSVRCVKD